jgi:hypothetical protein
MKLTILIPTRNRKAHVELLLSNLCVLFQDSLSDIEILISDNSEKPMQLENLASNVTVIRPNDFLATAEENLFFALKACNGDFIWPLGDDDIPMRDGVAQLLDFLENPTGDWAVINYCVIDYSGVLKSQRLISCSQDRVQMSYSEFVSIAGYQTTAACISLTVFKRSLLTDFGVSTVLNFQSPIYSHVALYLLSFGKHEGMFINFPLVNYRNNREATRRIDSNWANWSKKNNLPYRHPWTIGLVQQFNYLIDSGVLEEDFPRIFLETDHFGNKFSGMNQLIHYIIKQIESDQKLLGQNRMTHSDRKLLAAFLMRYAPQHIYLIESLNRDSIQRGFKKIPEIDRSDFLMKAFEASTGRFIFPHAVELLGKDGIVYKVPTGYIFLPHENLNYINILSALDFFNNSNLIFNKSLEMVVKDKRIGSKKYELLPLSLRTFSNFEPTYQKSIFAKIFKLRQLISKVVNR